MWFLLKTLRRVKPVRNFLFDRRRDEKLLERGRPL